MASGTAPLFGMLTRVDVGAQQHDPASHGIDLAMELQIAARAGEITLSSPGIQQRGRFARAWHWVSTLSFAQRS